MTLRELRADFAWVVVGANALVGAWAMGAHWLEPLRSRRLWYATVVAELTIVLEVVLGVALVAIDDYEVAQSTRSMASTPILTGGSMAAMAVGWPVGRARQARPFAS